LQGNNICPETPARFDATLSHYYLGRPNGIKV
jgi:hypothetical protein